MPDDHYIPASETMYTDSENVQNAIAAAFKVQTETELQHLIDDFVEKTVLNLFMDDHDKAVADTYTEVYHILEQYAVRTIYLGGADNLSSTKIRKLAECQEFMQKVIQKIV